jgi:hypothetical protein
MADIANQRFSLRMPTVTVLSPMQIALRAGLALALLIAGGIIALVGERMLGSSSPAGANEVRVTPFQDWRVICSNAQGGCTEL